jgi:hypothetical protein
MTWRVPALSAAVLLTLAFPAQAQVPPPAEPLNEENVAAWIEAHIDTDGWGLLAADTVAASFGSADGVVLGPDGYRMAEIRREYYGGMRLGPNGTRSGRQTWIVDCPMRRVWVRRITIYAENNLKGESRTRQAEQPNWTEVSAGSANEKLMSAICAADVRGVGL